MPASLNESLFYFPKGATRRAPAKQAETNCNRSSMGHVSFQGIVNAPPRCPKVLPMSPDYCVTYLTGQYLMVARAARPRVTPVPGYG